MRARPLVTALSLLATAVALSPPPAAAEPSKPTGRWLVVFEQARTARSSTAVSAVLSRAGARRSGRGAPKLGVVAVRASEQARAALRRDPAVELVAREYFRELRRVPNDPAPSSREDEWGGVPGGGPIQWALARQRFPAAWDVTTGVGAIVGVIDSGVDGGHPELAGRSASGDAVETSDPFSDPDGHGSHVSGLACAATGNGRGVAGAGWNCRLAVVKVPTPEIPDAAVMEGIRIATDRGAHAINMSLGGAGYNPAFDVAIDYAFQRGVVLVAAAANENTADQGSPAANLQPNDAADINAGRGLVVTSAEFSDRRAGSDSSNPDFTAVGYGPQISMAAYGFFDESEGPPGVISTYPGHSTERDLACQIPVLVCPRRSIGGDNRYAYLQGTSMATPQVSAAAALVARLNPLLSVREKLVIMKQTARRSGGWNPDLGWGILDAGRAVDVARRVDRVTPSSRARSRRSVRPRRGRRSARVRVRWSGSDPAGLPGLVPSGVRSYDLYVRRGRGRYRRMRRNTARRSALLRLRPGTYRFYTRALDRVGNREAVPSRPDGRVVVRRSRPLAGPG